MVEFAGRLVWELGSMESFFILLLNLSFGPARTRVKLRLTSGILVLYETRSSVLNYEQLTHSALSGAPQPPAYWQLRQRF